ncbi:PhnD/SsuA/transferrin family substrate-binding protein [Marinobacter sp.]|uniref:PhnD/SsuA/transferrin family substrate-binding protein n=1 Tax=Marinobacter sp. TaxID=50741 RepID=UPI003A8FCFA0
MLSAFELRQAWSGAVLTGLLVTTAASAEDTRILIGIESATSSTAVARYRLTEYLQSQGCEADIRFNAKAPGLALAFLPGMPGNSSPILVAVNRGGQLPVPVWVTRGTAGVRHIRELQGRDLATVAGTDPLGASLPLAALQQQGVTPKPGQLYEAGDYSSALGLLLHNNTHAAASELGFVKPFLTGNNLVVSWQGEPVKAAGWYRRAGWSRAAKACEQALARKQRSDDPQIFVIFPEWVNGFALPDSQNSEDSMQ